ncbi:hypothetical protein BD289DRAFT_442733 [Coniella lustricola]|uniref:Uncharacterized protein n=1 Tax=Coniella lustricola TaxID=2025994 RepID=A0A2T2ZXU9_9PEZI|nr:hypothetical protein BD289DRAFT_442733 [Coniella lustricola]
MSVHGLTACMCIYVCMYVCTYVFAERFYYSIKRYMHSNPACALVSPTTHFYVSVAVNETTRPVE